MWPLSGTGERSTYLWVRAAVVTWFVLIGLGILGAVAMVVGVDAAASTSTGNPYSRLTTPTSRLTTSTTADICSQYVPPC